MNNSFSIAFIFTIICATLTVGCTRPFGKGDQPLAAGRGGDARVLFEYALGRTLQNEDLQEVIGDYDKSSITWSSTFGGYSVSDPITVQGVVRGDGGSLTIWIKAYQSNDGKNWYMLSLGGLVRGENSRSSFDLITDEEYDELAHRVLGDEYTESWSVDRLLEFRVRDSLKAGRQTALGRSIHGVPIQVLANQSNRNSD